MREKQDRVMTLMSKNTVLKVGIRVFWKIERYYFAPVTSLWLESSLIAPRKLSLMPELSWGKFAISPMGLFRQIMNSTRLPSLCAMGRSSFMTESEHTQLN